MSVIPSPISSTTESRKDSDCELLDVSAIHKRRLFYLCKRCFDCVLSFIMLLVCLPLLLLLAILIKADSRGSVLFSNRALGQLGKEFKLYKFRSMHPLKESDAETNDVTRNILHNMPTKHVGGKPIYKTALADQARITRLGHFLRRTSLDELPQLWNVLRGDMSLVGPRPALPREAVFYTEQQMQRLLAKPGLTGLYQVTARNRVPVQEMIRIDLEYIRTESFWVDLEIICKTPFAMLKGL